MARGRKPKGLNEQIQTTKAEITYAEGKLKQLKTKLAELEKKKEDMELSELYNIIKVSGKSIEDVKDLIKE